MKETFTLVRTCVFGVATLFALLELALGAAITSLTMVDDNGYFSFAALDIATAILTMTTLPVMLLLSRYRNGAFTSMVGIEVGWTCFLWIMWLAVGAATASDLPFINCNFAFGLCPELQAMTAFGFLTWILLFAYNMTLFVLVFRQQLRGNGGVWTGYILETDFAAPGPSSSGYLLESKVDNYNMGNFIPQGPPVQAAIQPGGYITQPPVVPQHTAAPTMSSYPQV